MVLVLCDLIEQIKISVEIVCQYSYMLTMNN